MTYFATFTTILFAFCYQWIDENLAKDCVLSTGSKEYDLSYFADLTQQFVVDNTSKFIYYEWQLCKNLATNCTNTFDNEDKSGNVYYIESSTCYEVISSWKSDDIVVKEYNKNGETGITLEMYTGDSCPLSGTSNYGANFHIICSKTSEFDGITAVQDKSNDCRFNFKLKTNLVCSGKDVSSNYSDFLGLSWGYFAIIAFFTLIIIIFGAGYVIKSKKNGTWNCKKSFPCYNFCCLLPRYTWAGCQVTFEKCMTLKSKAKPPTIKKTKNVDDDQLLDDDEDDDVGIITPADDDPDIEPGAR